MLTNRQFELIEYLLNNREQTITSEKLSEVFHVSSRTIKSELTYLREFVEQFHSFILESIPAKGYVLKIVDFSTFFDDVSKITNAQNQVKRMDDFDRELQILKFIIKSKTGVNKEVIMHNFYISESSFYKIYNNLKKVLIPYNLAFGLTKQKSYYVKGNEKDKRLLITRYKLEDSHSILFTRTYEFDKVYDLLTDTFIEFEYQLTEEVLQNISSHILLMLQRIRDGHFIESSENPDLELKIEYSIAHAICSKLITPFHLAKSSFDYEVIYLTQTILGKSNFSTDVHLKTKVNDFIDYSFRNIYEKFGINFGACDKLKTYLALHLIPMSFRINSGTQLKNIMTSDIKQQFPYAFDIALYFSILFREHFGVEPLDDEISYLTLYFNYGIEDLDLSQSTKKVLIISSLRQSETILLRHKLVSWFPNLTIDITFTNPDEDLNNFEDYDAVLSTELFRKEYSNAVTLIKLFPDEKDFKKVNLSLNGYNSIHSIIEKFSEDCFFKGKIMDKSQILNIVCRNAIQKYNLNSDFLSQIESREQIASSYFGDMVAIPHPLSPITEDTFVSVGILEEPIQWDNNHMIQLVMLVSIEKNNPKAFQLWHYMSEIVRNHNLVKEILKSNDFNEFVQIVSKPFINIEAN